MERRFPNIEDHLMTYHPAATSTVFTGGQGIRCYAENGQAYLNLNDISCVLGYGHPRFTQTLSKLVTTKLLAHPGMFSPEKEKLVQHMMQVTHGDFDKLLVTSSGGEVVDWALKAARRATGRDGIVSFRHALHGRSFAGAYISDIPFRKEGFGSGLANVTFWDYPSDGREMEPAAEACSDIAAIIIEPYQAAGDMASPSKAYWQWLRRFTREQGIILILDEIQTGFGKTGSFFAYEEAGIVPDILLAGKGMSNGFGLGAMLMSRAVAEAVGPGPMSGGSADNDLMCSVVNLVFDIFEDEQILANVRTVGQRLREGLAAVFAAQGIDCSFCGAGLFFSVALQTGLAAQLAPRFRERGVLLGRHGDCLTFRPPLVMTEADAEEVCAAVEAVLPACTQQE